MSDNIYVKSKKVIGKKNIKKQIEIINEEDIPNYKPNLYINFLK